MVEVLSGHFRCWADTCRTLPPKSPHEYSSTAILVSLFGRFNSVKATWARIVDAGARTSVAEVGGTPIALAAGGRYLAVKQPMPDGCLHLLLVHEAATAKVSPFADSFVILGNARDTFFPRLSRACTVPLRKSWAPKLWDIGQAIGQIQSLDGFGMQAHRLEIDNDKWSTAVSAGVAGGVLR